MLFYFNSQWLKKGLGLRQIFLRNHIRVPINAVFALADVQEAHRTYALGTGVGSIVLDVSSH
jgi:hypothetical protein